MIARTLSAPYRLAMFLVLLLMPAAGCSGLGRRHEAKRIPQFGIIDPDQARELHKVSLPPYVVEPPDELDIDVKPPFPDWSTATIVVQADGIVDLGFVGDVYVAGLTLAEVEQKISEKLTAGARVRNQRPVPSYQVSVRLANGQSKFYYVLGAVANQNRYRSTGSETVLDAILQAGLRSNSLPEKAYLVRPHPAGGPDLVLKIDWFGIRDRGDTLTNYQVMPGDRIIVPGTKPAGLLGSLLGL